MVTHAASSVGLNHGVDARGLEHAFRKVRLKFRSECLNDNKVTVTHAVIIRPNAIADFGAGFQNGRLRTRGLLRKIVRTQGIIRR
jgi:hypothetical protein